MWLTLEWCHPHVVDLNLRWLRGICRYSRIRYTRYTRYWGRDLQQLILYRMFGTWLCDKPVYCLLIMSWRMYIFSLFWFWFMNHFDSVMQDKWVMWSPWVAPNTVWPCTISQIILALDLTRFYLSQLLSCWYLREAHPADITVLKHWFIGILGQELSEDLLPSHSCSYGVTRCSLNLLRLYGFHIQPQAHLVGITV